MASVAEDVFNELTAFYGRSLNEQAKKFYIGCLDALHERDLIRASVAIMQKERQFPTIHTVKQYCEEVRLSRWEKQKARTPKFPSDLSATTEHGKEAIRLMIDLYEKRINRQQYLEGMLAMETKYPGSGWQQCAKELKEFWDTEPERHAKGDRLIAEFRKNLRDPRFKKDDQEKA